MMKECVIDLAFAIGISVQARRPISDYLNQECNYTKTIPGMQFSEGVSSCDQCCIVPIN